MQRFDLVEKLAAAENQADSLLGDLKTFVKNFVEAHRKFPDGQKVEVFDYAGKSYGIGFVRSAQCSISWKYGFNPSDYLGKEEKWLKELSDIMYEIVKAKKDGTQSTRSLLWDKPRQEKTLGYYHLMPIE